MSQVPERVRIPRHLWEQLVEHCRAERPNEACGVLGMEGTDVVEVFELTNAERSPVRYRFDPQEQFRMDKLLRERGWNFSLFHSHTRTEAYPSPTDVKDAYEVVPYVIVSLAADEPVVRAFRILKEDWVDVTGEVQEVPVEVVG
jgi:proteasome lid subunit RPN8/RPN11